MAGTSRSIATSAARPRRLTLLELSLPARVYQTEVGGLLKRGRSDTEVTPIGSPFFLRRLLVLNLIIDRPFAAG